MKKLYTLLLTLSLGTVTAQAATKTVKHTIKNGETLYTIAHKNHTTIEEVRKANGLKKGDLLKLGRVLKVPTNTYFPDKKKKIAKKTNAKKSTSSAKYAIKNGDTLFTIARKHHTTIEEVRKANGLKKGDTLKLGRVLKVPKNTYFPNKKKSTKVALKDKNKKIAKTKKSSKRLVKKSETKKLRIAQAKKKRQEQKLAKTLMNIKSKRIVKRDVEKSNKFSLEDIFFSGSSKSKSKKMTKLAKKKLGKRYVWGAVGQKNTFDCSGFTTYVCKKNGISIPRRAIEQSKHGKYISRNQLKPGDLIFFDTSKRRKGYVNHVGIYLGNDKFIHASSAKKKVVITKLGKSFYSKRYKGARRVTS